MRLKPKGPPHTTHRALGDAELLGKQPRAPVRRLAGPRIERSGNQLLDLRVAVLARRSGARLIQQAVEPALQKPLLPFGHCVAVDTTATRHRGLTAFLRARQDDSRAHRKRLRGLVPPRPLHQLATLFGAQSHQCLVLHLPFPVCSAYLETRRGTIRSLIYDSGH